MYSGTKKNLVTVSYIKLRRTRHPEREEVTGDWRKLHKELLVCIYQVTRSRRIRGARQISCMQERRDAYWCWWYS